MKKLFFRLLVLLCLVALFFVGFDWALTAGGWISWLPGPGAEWKGMRAIESPWLNQGVGLAMMLLPIFALLSWFLVGRDESISARAKDGDLINLEPRAIERVICRQIRSKVEEVVRVDAFAQQGPGKRAKVRVNVAVTDRVPVPQVRSAVRREAVKVLEHLLGVADTSQVRVVVYDVAGRSVPEGKRPLRRERPAPRKRAAEVTATESLPAKRSEM